MSFMRSLALRCRRNICFLSTSRTHLYGFHRFTILDQRRLLSSSGNQRDGAEIGRKKNKIEVVHKPIVLTKKTETSPEKNLHKSPYASIRSMLSFDSHSSTSFRSNNTPKETMLESKQAPEAASADPLQMIVHKRLNRLLEEPRKNQPGTIHRVPASFREKRKDLYEPRMVSIGPYYHGREELRAIEKHKWWYLHDFMSRKPEIGLDIYLREIRKLESQARQCYSDSVQLSTDEFALMLLLDGCFILEYFLKYENKETDVLCDVGWGRPTIIADLLLLENQIPFFILHKLASLPSDLKEFQTCEDGCDLIRKLCKLSSLLPYQEMLKPPVVSCETIQHLLHLYYICLIPESCKSLLQAREGKESDQLSAVIPSAAELRSSGVKFWRNSSHSLFDINFKKGVIEMPVLVIDNTIRTIFSNLVAFEQSQISRPRIFTSYVVLWNMLIDTARDVKILENCGILELVQCNEEQAAKFFNEWADCWSMDYDKHYYALLFQQLQEHRSNIWKRSVAKLTEDLHNILLILYKPFAAKLATGGAATLFCATLPSSSSDVRAGVEVYEILCHFVH